MKPTCFNIIVYLACDQSPCNNNGTCQYHAGNYICVCLPGFTGEFCNNTYPSQSMLTIILNLIGFLYYSNL